jgi:hypothetical protein
MIVRLASRSSLVTSFEVVAVAVAETQGERHFMITEPRQ